MMESNEVSISRAARQCNYPANFQLVAAMNPTPGGYGPDDPRSQRYSPEQIQRYLSRLSGPFLDRIDLHIEVPALPKEVLMADTQPEHSATVRERVCEAWNRQMSRQGCGNAELSGKALEQHCQLGQAERLLLDKAIEKCRKITHQSLKDLYEPGMTPEELSARWSMFGEDPFIVGAEGPPPFSARKYITPEICQQIIERLGGTVAR